MVHGFRRRQFAAERIYPLLSDGDLPAQAEARLSVIAADAGAVRRPIALPRRSHQRCEPPPPKPCPPPPKPCPPPPPKPCPPPNACPSAMLWPAPISACDQPPAPRPKDDAARPPQPCPSITGAALPTRPGTTHVGRGAGGGDVFCVRGNDCTVEPAKAAAGPAELPRTLPRWATPGARDTP